MSEDAGRMARGGPKPGGGGGIALALAGGVAASRALGYLRDVLLADRVGAGGSTGPTDTYDNWLDLDEGI